MKLVLKFVVLSLGLAACAVEPLPESGDDLPAAMSENSVAGEETSVSSSQSELGLGATTQSCGTPFFSCEASCPFNGQRNVIVQVCDGVEIVIREFPCTPEGCF